MENVIMEQCMSGELTCQELGNGFFAVYSENMFSNNKTVRIWDASQNKFYSAKGVITPEDYTNLRLDSNHYMLKVNENGEIYVEHSIEGNNREMYTPAGTYYNSVLENNNISALVIGGVVAAVIIGGTVLYLTKNPPLAGEAALGTGEVISGQVGAQVIKKALDVIATYVVTTFLTQDQAKAFETLFHQSETIPPVYSDPLLIDLNGDGIFESHCQALAA